MHQYRVSEDRVERIVREGKSVRVAYLKAHVREAALDGKVTCPLNLRLLEVNADHAPGATTLASPRVMVPGPQPTSSTFMSGRRCDKKKAASRAAVREATHASKAGFSRWE